MRNRNWFGVFFWSLQCCGFLFTGDVAEAGHVRVVNHSTNFNATIYFSGLGASGGGYEEDSTGIAGDKLTGHTIGIPMGCSYSTFMPDNMYYSVTFGPDDIWNDALGKDFYSIFLTDFDVGAQVNVEIPTQENLDSLLHPKIDSLIFFEAGMSLGLLFGGTALCVRLARQPGQTTPQI